MVPYAFQKPKKAASDSRIEEAAAAAGPQSEPANHPTRQQQRRRVGRSSSEMSQEMMEEQALKYGASHVIHLFVPGEKNAFSTFYYNKCVFFAPVSLCMAVVILTMLTVGYYTEEGEYL
jgi:hypothetical protein